MAMAPEQTGIGIRRHFTNEAVDPYDEVVWERRDARITNFRDGTMAFEQRNVEFPIVWSQNATNIVAQKYFRGHLGSPERESSLRQVINRVVDTITAWGRKDGYFVDDEEAEAFRSELKYLILHQKAAFNSPVWFNIGVKGEPQQASACQPYHAPVSTPEGLVPIGRLVETHALGAKVFDAGGVTRVVAVKNNGRKVVLRIHARTGHTLDVTSDHLVWRQHGDDGRFVAAGVLKPGDQLEWHRTESWGDGQGGREETARAALAGWLQAGGFVVRDGGQGPSGPSERGTRRRQVALEAVVVGDAERAWVDDAIAVAFPGASRHEERVSPDAPGADSRRIRITGDRVARFVDDWGFAGRTVDAAVPPHLFTAPLPVVAAYLRSLFQAEGYLSVRRRKAVVGLAMASEQVVRGIQSLLLRFGIFSKVRFIADSRPTGHGYWVLNVSVAADGRRFADEIGFVDPAKASELESAAASAPDAAAPAVKSLTVDRIEVLGEMPVYDIQTESGEYLSGNIRVHNCFILSVDDTMRSILNWYVEEGTIFKGGSGAGINLSAIRSSQEQLKGGGAASGPVSFMRGADASAGTIKSGGKTRRAAKMVILNADHPDVEDFIWCKAVEERKARVLRDAGFDMDLDGKDSHSLQYQNANNSVRLTDEFMQAVLDDADWHMRAVTTGDILKTVKARDLFRQIAEAAWECADPGVQYDTTINRWHTASNTARINASNPCFPGDARVHTDKGLIRFVELIDRVRLGETFGIYTDDATNPNAPSERVEITTPEAFMITGLNEIVKLRFENGMELRCTPNHRVFTANRGYVTASELTAEDQVKTLGLPAPAVNADRRLPVSTDVREYEEKGDWSRSLRLPEKWTQEFAHYLGWLVGDGCMSGNVVTTVYGGDDDQHDVLPAHLDLLAWMNGDRAPTPSEQPNGTVQLRQSRRFLARFLEALGVTHAKAADKAVPWAVEQAPPEAVAAFLRGLFDADGCVYDGEKSRYVGLGSSSVELLRGVQRLLTTLGITSRIYPTTSGTEKAFEYVRKDGSVGRYAGRPMYDLRITGRSIGRFAADIGFNVSRKQAQIDRLLASHRFYVKPTTTRLVERVDDGVELTYNLSEPRNHSYIVNGLAVRNCSEYMHLDNSACNLASLNLLTFLGEGGRFDVAGFRAAVEVVFTAQEILVGNADYPTDAIGQNARRFRQLGLGYANLGAMLMALGLPYDSDAGRAWAAAITSLMTGHAYATSARTASRMGPFAGYSENREPMNRVLRMHREEVAKIDEELVSVELLSAAQESWDTAVALSEVYGVRNSQASVMAPTGTIGLMMDCDTTGIEPDLSLCKTKKLVGGGTMTIVNQTVPRALRRLGYSPEQVAEIIAYIDENKSIVGAPHLAAEHLPVFACSMGDNTIHYLGHVKMMGAIQPFVSGALSKTVNVPEDVTVEDVEQLHIDAWRLGVKAIAIYRDNCKVAQPLATTKKADKAAALTIPAERLVETVIVKEPVREKLPRRRNSKTFSFRVADCHGYVTVGEYEDGRPGEIFLRVAKQGSTLAGIMDAFAISVSHGLQYGVPLKAFVDMYTNMRFEPAGMTDDPDIRFASSLVDYIFRRLAVEYLPFEDRAELGILTIDERMQPTLPGVEEQVTPTSTGSEVVPDPAPALLPAPAPTAAPTVDAGPTPQASDAPYCYQCGMVMQRAGACFVCSSCGTTSGCS